MKFSKGVVLPKVNKDASERKEICIGKIHFGNILTWTWMCYLFVLLLNKQDNGSGTAARCNSDEVSAKTMSVAELVQETLLVVGDTKYCT